VLRLEPGNPWIERMFAELSKYSTREPKTSDLFPIEVVWSARRTDGGAEGHIISMSFSPRGGFLGLATDLALWRAGRSDDAKISRVEYGGEGITAFPGSPIPGNVFVRGNSIVWSSDLETARRAVDLVLAREKPVETPAGDGAPRGDTTPPAVMALVPAAGHTLAGAIAGDGGAVARTLALLPGDALDVPESELSRADLSFAFDATSGDVAEGEVTLAFPPDAPTAGVAAAAEDFARRLGSLKWGDVAFEATPRIEGPRAILAVKATGLSTLYAKLLQEAVKVRRTLERSNSGAETAPGADPNQSSSTFQ
jgi:hypothetical protein